MRIWVCGTRGSTPAPGRAFLRYGGHTSCLALARDGQRPSLLLDAGTGLRTVTALLGEAPFQGSILLGHLHWDHTQGLPFFRAGDDPGARVDVYIPAQGDSESVLARFMSPPHFPITPSELRGAWSFNGLEEGEAGIEGFTVLAREIPHKGGRTFGYRVSDGHSAIAYLPDHCPTALGPGPDGWGEYHPAALELAEGVDVLVHDAQLLPEELAAEATFGHAASDYAVGLGGRAGARSVALFHHRPDRTDDALDALGRRLGAAPVSVLVGSEATVLDL